MPVGVVWFAAGSDVTGPMGRTLVPVAGREEAEHFLKDHHGARHPLRRGNIPQLLREVAGK